MGAGGAYHPQTVVSEMSAGAARCSSPEIAWPAHGDGAETLGIPAPLMVGPQGFEP